MPASGAKAMATGTLDGVIRHLRRVVLLRDGGGLTDGQLLEQYLAKRDEAAFEALVRRHGPMVLGVCRRVLHHAHDAEDAFQATFLVLVRKAASVAPRELVGHWLYGVAYRTALKAKALSARRHAKERQVRDMSRQEALEEDTWQDLQPLLDQELNRLPEKYQVPLVLCYLQGKCKREVARQLGLPEGTVSSRLARAREMLRQRLAGRGLALTVGSLAAALSQGAASAAVPAPLVGSTVQAATLFAAGKAAAAGIVSAKVVTITEGVLKAMFVTKLKIATAVLLTLGVLGSGVGVLTHRALAEPPKKEATANPKTEKEVPPNANPEKEQKPAPEVEKKPSQEVEKPAGPQRKKPGTVGKLDAVDVGKNTITMTVTGKDGQPQQKTFAVGPEAEILLDGKKAKLGDLKTGSEVRLALADGAKGEAPKVLSVEMGEAKREGGDPKKGDGQPDKKKGEPSPDK